MDRAVPALPSRDFSATERFYGSFGFTTRYHGTDWLVLERESVELEFFPFPELDPWTSSFRCSLRVRDADGFHDAVAAAGVAGNHGVPRLEPVLPRAWGQRAGYLVDGDGMLIAIIQDEG